MMTIDKLLELAVNLLALVSAIAAIVSKLNQLEARIAALHYHVESHCLRLTHISEHLEEVTDYHPIGKLDFE